MTLDRDFCMFLFEGGSRPFLCNQLGVEWPPPEELELFGFKFKQIRRSQLTDEQAKDCDFIARGAEYKCVQESKLEDSQCAKRASTG